MEKEELINYLRETDLPNLGIVVNEIKSLLGFNLEKVYSR